MRRFYFLLIVGLFRWMLLHMTFALPVQRICETETLLAFMHPSPSYPLHILLVPKKGISSFADLDPVTDAGFLKELTLTVQKIVAEYDLKTDGYRLIVNGGAFQDFPHLHFHLISEKVSN